VQPGSSGLTGSDGLLLPPPQPRRTLGLHPKPSPKPNTPMNLDDFIDSGSPPTSAAPTPARADQTKVVELAFSPQTLSGSATIQSAAVTPARPDKAQTQELLRKTPLYSAPAGRPDPVVAISSTSHAKLQSVSSKCARPSLSVLPPPPALAAPLSGRWTVLPANRAVYCHGAPAFVRLVHHACVCATSPPWR